MITTIILLAAGGLYTLAIFLAGMLYRGRVGKHLESEIGETNLLDPTFPENKN